MKIRSNCMSAESQFSCRSFFIYENGRYFKRNDLCLQTYFLIHLEINHIETVRGGGAKIVPRDMKSGSK